MPNITPFFWFDNNAEEAVDFYLSVFPNSRRVGELRAGDLAPSLLQRADRRRALGAVSVGPGVALEGGCAREKHRRAPVNRCIDETVLGEGIASGMHEARAAFVFPPCFPRSLGHCSSTAASAVRKLKVEARLRPQAGRGSASL